jgi:hypothetical protein
MKIFTIWYNSNSIPKKHIQIANSESEARELFRKENKNGIYSCSPGCIPEDWPKELA